jgi:RNA polymerase sigma factor (sigma-70 family)
MCKSIFFYFGCNKVGKLFVGLIQHPLMKNWMEYKAQIWPIKDRLFRLALRLVGDRAEAEDVVQEVLIKVWRQGQDLALIQNFEAWCVRLTRNLALDKLKGGYRKRRTELEPHRHTLTTGLRPDYELESRDQMGYLQKLMKQLPEAQRLCMHLRDIEGLSYQEISEHLELNMAQVKSNIFRARQAMRRQLENRHDL